MEKPSDIRILIKFTEANEFPVRFLLGVLESIDRAIAQAEDEEIDALETEFSGSIPSAVFDAIRYRSERLVAQSLNIDAASNGSIILGGAAAAVAYWLLDKTLGETLKDAWVKTELHQRIQEFLINRVTQKAHDISDNIRPSRWSRSDHDLAVSVAHTGDAVVITVVAKLPQELAPIPPMSRVELPDRRQTSSDE